MLSEHSVTEANATSVVVFCAVQRPAGVFFPPHSGNLQPIVFQLNADPDIRHLIIIVSLVK